MLYDFQNFWASLIAAFLVGAAVGLLTWSNTPRKHWFAGWAIWGLIAFVVGIAVALLQLFPGRAGLWLETALLAFAVYIIGCFVGGWIKSLFDDQADPKSRARAAGKPLMLSLDITGLPFLPAYEVEAVDAKGALQAQAHIVTAKAGVRLQLAQGLRRGNYFVRIYSPARELLREYGVQID